MACRVAALESRTRSIAAHVLAIDSELLSRAGETTVWGISLTGMTHSPRRELHKPYVPQSCQLIISSTQCGWDEAVAQLSHPSMCDIEDIDSGNLIVFERHKIFTSTIACSAL